jgi:hypothetical protein
VSHDHTIAQAVSRRLPIAAAHVRNQSVCIGPVVDKMALGQWCRYIGRNQFCSKWFYSDFREFFQVHSSHWVSSVNHFNTLLFSVYIIAIGRMIFLGRHEENRGSNVVGNKYNIHTFSLSKILKNGLSLSQSLTINLNHCMKGEIFFLVPLVASENKTSRTTALWWRISFTPIRK